MATKKRQSKKRATTKKAVNTNQPSNNTQAEKTRVDSSAEIKPTSEQLPDNVHNLNDDASASEKSKATNGAAKDINQKLTAIEETLNTLETRFYFSHDEFNQLIAGINERSDDSNEQIKQLQSQLSKLNSSYQVLDTQSGRLAKESGRLALLIDKLNVPKLEAIGAFEEDLLKRLDNDEQSFAKLDKSLNENLKRQQQALDAVKDQLNQEKQSLLAQVEQQQHLLQAQANDINNYSSESVKLQKQLQGQQNELKAQQSDVERIAKQVAAHDKANKTLKSQQSDAKKQLKQATKTLKDEVTAQLQQLAQALAQSNIDHSAKQQFLDQKQQQLLKLNEQTQDDLQSHIAKQDEISTSISMAQQSHVEKLIALEDKQQYQYKDLLAQYQTISKAQQVFEEKAQQQDTLLQTLEEKISSLSKALEEQGLKFQDYEQRWSAENEAMATKLEQQIEFDQGLAKANQELEKRTENLEQHQLSFENEQQRLGKISNENIEGNKKNQRQIAYLEGRGKQQFNFLGLSLIALIIALGAIGLFSYQEVQKMRQKDSDLVDQAQLQKTKLAENQSTNEKRQSQLETALTDQNQQITKQQQGLQSGQQQRQQIEQNVASLKAEIAKQQQQLVEKDKTIKNLSQNLAQIDDNIQYLNSSLSPYRDYGLNSPIEKLQKPQWMLKQNGENYTIELLHANNKNQIFEYIRRYGYYLQEPMSYVQTQAEPANFVLSYGSFSEQALANQALEQLPGSVSYYNQGITQFKNLLP